MSQFNVETYDRLGRDISKDAEEAMADVGISTETILEIAGKARAKYQESGLTLLEAIDYAGCSTAGWLTGFIMGRRHTEEDFAAQSATQVDATEEREAQEERDADVAQGVSPNVEDDVPPSDDSDLPNDGDVGVAAETMAGGGGLELGPEEGPND